MPGYQSTISLGTEPPGPADDPRPELSDIPRYGRMLVRRFVTQARAAEQPTFRSLITEHLGVSTDDLPVVEEHWPAYEHVNVQAALDAWLDDAVPTGSSAWRTTVTGGRSGSPTCSARTAARGSTAPGPATSPGSACPADPRARPGSACAPR